MNEKTYLRRVLIPDEKVNGELLEEKLEIFEGTPEDVKKDKDYWINEKGAQRIQYFELKEYASSQ